MICKGRISEASAQAALNESERKLEAAELRQAELDGKIGKGEAAIAELQQKLSAERNRSFWQRLWNKRP